MARVASILQQHYGDVKRRGIEEFGHILTTTLEWDRVRVSK